MGASVSKEFDPVRQYSLERKQQHKLNSGWTADAQTIKPSS
jgi:hypothetical protein